MSTERPSPRYAEIDAWQPADSLEAMIEGQFAGRSTGATTLGRWLSFPAAATISVPAANARRATFSWNAWARNFLRVYDASDRSIDRFHSPTALRSSRTSWP